MHIRFIKDYKCYTKGTIIKVNSAFARKFVNDGYAVQIASSHRIGDLYVAPIIKPTDFQDSLYSDGNIIHMGIFTKDFSGDYVGYKTTYKHILTKNHQSINILQLIFTVNAV